MEDKKLYQEQKQSQIDAFEERIGKLKVKASESEGQYKNELYEQIETAELDLSEGKAKLKEFEKINKDKLEAYKKDIDEAFMSINSRLAMS